MKYTLYLIVFFIYFGVITPGYCQYNYSPIPFTDFGSEEKIDSILNNNPTKNIKHIIYIPSQKVSSYCSILIAKMKKMNKYWVFQNDSIMHTGILESDSVFGYPYYKKTGVVVRENPPMKFIAPLMCQESDIECIIYKEPRVSFFFEFGNISYFRMDNQRIKYRKEWLEIIRRELKDILNDEK